MESMVKSRDPFEGVFKGKRVLITGHTGFKGGWLSLWLNELGADVIGYALKAQTSPNFYELCKIKDKTTSIIADIRNAEKLNLVFKKYKPEFVFHLAAQPLVRVSYQNPLETYQTNVIGTLNVLEAFRHTASAKVAIIVTSDKCYENQGLRRGYKETDPMGGHDIYSSSKGCVELLTSSFSRSFLDAGSYAGRKKVMASVRAGNVIGGGDWAKDRLVPDCVRFLSKNKDILIRNHRAVRPWQHVLEPLYGYLLLAQHLDQKGKDYTGAWNFGPNPDNTKNVQYIVENVIKLWKSKQTIRLDKRNAPHEASFLSLDSHKARKVLKWSPRWGIRETLQRTVEWYHAYYEGKDIEGFTRDQILNYCNLLAE